MPEKRVLILASSIKKSARCVAGREIIQHGGKARLGGWIRPVSGSGEGELLPHHYALQQGGSASVLDVVDVPLKRQQSDPGQPENWLIDDSTQWSKVRAVAIDKVAGFAEHPADLWLESGVNTDRISPEAQMARDQLHSIVLIQPQNLKIRKGREFNKWKTRACFNYRGTSFALSVTDPVFLDRQFAKSPEAGGPREWIPCSGENVLLCISLTPPFNGFHYKVVATVFALP